MPFFNVEWDGHGVIAGIGWTEGWTANFTANGKKSLSVKVGPSLGHFVLHPGEEVPACGCSSSSGRATASTATISGANFC